MSSPPKGARKASSATPEAKGVTSGGTPVKPPLGGPTTPGSVVSASSSSPAASPPTRGNTASSNRKPLGLGAVEMVSGAEKYGWLDKLSKSASAGKNRARMSAVLTVGKNKWNRRFFVLRDRFLYYYASDVSSSPKGSVDLDEYHSVTQDLDKNTERHCFRLISLGKAHTFYASAESPEDLKAWMEALRGSLIHAPPRSSSRDVSPARSFGATSAANAAATTSTPTPAEAATGGAVAPVTPAGNEENQTPSSLSKRIRTSLSEKLKSAAKESSAVDVVVSEPAKEVPNDSTASPPSRVATLTKQFLKPQLSQSELSIATSVEASDAESMFAGGSPPKPVASSSPATKASGDRANDAPTSSSSSKEASVAVGDSRVNAKDSADGSSVFSETSPAATLKGRELEPVSPSNTSVLPAMTIPEEVQSAFKKPVVDSPRVARPASRFMQSQAMAPRTTRRQRSLFRKLVRVAVLTLIFAAAFLSVLLGYEFWLRPQLEQDYPLPSFLEYAEIDKTALRYQLLDYQYQITYGLQGLQRELQTFDWQKVKAKAHEAVEHVYRSLISIRWKAWSRQVSNTIYHLQDSLPTFDLEVGRDRVSAFVAKYWHKAVVAVRELF